MAATYYSTRGMTSYGYNSRRTGNSAWSPNRNAVRHKPGINLGPISFSVLVSLVVAVLGIAFLSKSASVTTYDRAIANTNSELTNLEAERDALAVENAKINAAAANIDQNRVASSMVDAASSAYVAE